MKKIIIFVWFMMFVYVYNFAAFEDMYNDSRSFALLKSNIADSKYLNTENWASNKNKTFFVSNFNYLYELSDLSLYNASGFYSWNKWQIGVHWQKFGNDLYNENSFLLYMGYSILDGMNVGLSMNYYMLTIEGYDSGNSFGVSAYFNWIVNKNWVIGSVLNNIYASKDNQFDKETAAKWIKFGVKYCYNDELNLFMSVNKQMEFNADVLLGIEYTLFDIFTIQSAYNIKNPIYGIGVGGKWKFLNLNYGIQVHPVLGLSHSLSLSFSL